ASRKWMACFDCLGMCPERKDCSPSIRGSSLGQVVARIVREDWRNSGRLSTQTANSIERQVGIRWASDTLRAELNQRVASSTKLFIQGITQASLKTRG